MSNYLLVLGCAVLLIAFVLLSLGIDVLPERVEQERKLFGEYKVSSKEKLVFLLLDSAIALLSLVASVYIMDILIKIFVLAIAIASLAFFFLYV